MVTDFMPLIALCLLAAAFLCGIARFAWREQIQFLRRRAGRLWRSAPWRPLGGERWGAIGLGFALTLCACAPIAIGTPVTPPPAVAVALVGTGYGFDVAYREAAQDFKALASGLSAADKAAGKALFAQLLTCPAGAVSIAACHGYIAASAAAVDASDQGSLTQQLASVSRLIGQIHVLLHPGGALVAPTVAALAAPAS
jgi:hypothetical protein